MPRSYPPLLLLLLGSAAVSTSVAAPAPLSYPAPPPLPTQCAPFSTVGDAAVSCSLKRLAEGWTYLLFSSCDASLSGRNRLRVLDSAGKEVAVNGEENACEGRFDNATRSAVARLLVPCRARPDGFTLYQSCEGGAACSGTTVAVFASDVPPLSCVASPPPPPPPRAPFLCGPDDNPAICAALGDLYYATGGDGWRDNSNWGEGASYCTFIRLSCMSGGALISLNLGRNNLVGTLPESLGALTDLTDLNMEGNKLVGAIPASIGSLTSLEQLLLWGNQLSSLPDVFEGLDKLSDLYVYSNALTGQLPASLGRLANLRALLADYNQFTSLPESMFSGLGALQQLSLSFNQLSSTLPPAIASLTSLTQLALNHNELSGTMPAAMRDGLMRLQDMDLKDSGLCGTCPTYHQPDDGPLPACPTRKSSLKA